MKKGFIILEHPADIGIEAYGQTLAEAFQQAAEGLMSIIIDSSTVSSVQKQDIDIAASDYEQLLVKWLSEILYLYDGKQFVSKEFNIKKLTSTQLNAIVGGEPLSAIKHRTNIDVKAITYHQLVVRMDKENSFIRVFFDI